MNKPTIEETFSIILQSESTLQESGFLCFSILLGGVSKRIEHGVEPARTLRSLRKLLQYRAVHHPLLSDEICIRQCRSVCHLPASPA